MNLNPFNEKPELLLERIIEEQEILARDKWSHLCSSIRDKSLGRKTAQVLENISSRLGINPHYNFANQTFNETVKSANIGNWDKFAFDMVRAVFPNLIAHEIVDVQPMPGPVGLLFYLDFLFAQNKGQIRAGQSAFDSISGPTDSRTYSSDEIDRETVALGDGTTGPYNFTLSRLPIRQGSVLIDFGGGVQAFDDGAGNLSGPGVSVAGSIDYDSGFCTVTTDANVTLNVSILASYRYDMEANDDIPQIDMQLTTSPVFAEVRKLKAVWSVESEQNAKSLHGIDVEAELVGAIAEEIKFEKDREIINDLSNMALAGVYLFNSTVPAGVSFTEHKLSFIDSCIAGGNLVYASTKRGQTNFIVASLGASNIIESLPSFVAVPGLNEAQSSAGVIKAGVLHNRWTVYKDPYLGVGSANPNTMLMGYKSNNKLHCGYIYAPYQEFYVTPTVRLDDFKARKGMASQYGKKAVNARFYTNGLIVP